MMSTDQVLGMVYAVAAKKGAGVAKALSVVSGVFFGFVIITIVGVLNVFSCNDFFANIILPFGLRQPLTLLLAPLTFIILASLGSGATVEDMQEVYARVDEMDDKQLGERLGELGQVGRAIAPSRTPPLVSSHRGRASGRAPSCGADRSGTSRSSRARAGLSRTVALCHRSSALHRNR
jgi:hypothetical protein